MFHRAKNDTAQSENNKTSDKADKAEKPISQQYKNCITIIT